MIISDTPAVIEPAQRPPVVKEQPIVSKPNTAAHEPPVTDGTDDREPAGNLSYFQSRMSALGVTDEANTVVVEHDCYDDYVARQTAIFSENERGGIDILYVGLGGLKTYLKNGRKEVPYVRTRLHPDHEKTGLPKYITPRGAGTQVFFPPLVLRAYDEQRVIDTLFVTEGEFKAFKASLHGLYCVGTQGIHNTHEKDSRGNNILNTELEQLLRTCKVKNVVLLFDNDCLTVEYDEEKDLFVRPNSFFSAVKNFREYTKHLKCDVYFSHLKTDLDSKGIDDLLCAAKGDEAVVALDLLTINRQEGQYFITQNVTEKSLKALRSYFHVTDVQEFYNYCNEVLKDKKFRYNKTFYQHDGNELKALIDEAILKFLRIGNEYFKKINVPDKSGRLVPTLVGRLKSTITDDYGRDAIKYIPKYEAPTLVPSHHNYRQVIEHCYNTYHQLTHQPLPGTIDNSLAMVRHIFKDKYEFGLDYLQLLYMRPEQLLPILLLQSKARNTGKSTFGQWLMDIFQNNAVKLGNADLENDFNSTYAERLVIVVDETAIEKKATSEAIKRMSTEQGKIFVNAKGRQQYETDWIGKFIFITNTINTALYIGKGETRYFVRTIEKLPGMDDPDMIEKLRDEIPAFLHFLERRSLHHARRGRMYFDFSDYQTSELGSAVEANKTSLEREVASLIEDTFDAFANVALLEFAPCDLASELKGRCKYPPSETDIKKVLKDEFNLEPEKQTRYDWHSLRIHQSNDSDQNSVIKRNGKPYIFTRAQFSSSESANS